MGISILYISFISIINKQLPTGLGVVGLEDKRDGSVDGEDNSSSQIDLG